MEDYKKNFILNMLAYAVQKDVLLEQLCKLSGLELQAMKKGSSIEATPKQVNDLWLNASYLSNDPLFGLHFGESLTLAALGIVGQIIQNSRTVGEALTHGAAFVHLLTDLFGMEVTRSSKSFTIRFVPTGKAEKEMAFAFRQMMDLSMVFVLHEVDGLVLEKIKPKSVRTPHAEINPREYERVLRCKAVKKNQEYAMEFDGRYWDEPIITANYELQSLLLQKVAAMRPAGNHQSLKEKIANFLITNTYLSMPTLEEIAANFNTSSRSLQRRLQAEGITYQQLADSSRKSLALHYLASGNYQVKEISYILGYNEMSAFTRAFKRWTGTTPANYQRA